MASLPTSAQSLQRYATVSCHVEQPLHDEVWARYRELLARRVGGFVIASLMRPPDPSESEAGGTWLQRAEEAAKYGPLGHHTHFGGPTTARPPDGSPPPADRVVREAAWLREHGVRARFFCGGGWYIDEAVALAVADAGYIDCTATDLPPSYLSQDAARARLAGPAWVVLPGGKRMLELPTTHGLGRLLRTPPSKLPPVVHFYFHDTDLVSARRRMAIVVALRMLGRLRRPRALAEVAAQAGPMAPELSWADVAA
jgi:hypothetical protein